MLVKNALVKPHREFVLNIRSPENGHVSIKLDWHINLALTAVFTAPDFKTICANKIGKSPLSLASTPAAEALKGIYEALNISNEKIWQLKLVNTSDSTIDVIISVDAPSGTLLQQELSTDELEDVPAEIALFARTLGEYVRPVALQTNEDLMVKAALDVIPNSRATAERILGIWWKIPESTRNNLSADIMVFERNIKIANVKVVESFNKSTAFNDAPTRDKSTNKTPVMKGPFTERTYKLEYTGLICERACSGIVNLAT